jgi:hypothetical protein
MTVVTKFLALFWGLGMVVRIELTADELALIKQATNQNDETAAVTEAAKKFLRISQLRQLKSASGKVEFIMTCQELESLESGELLRIDSKLPRDRTNQLSTAVTTSSAHQAMRQSEKGKDAFDKDSLESCEKRVPDLISQEELRGFDLPRRGAAKDVTNVAVIAYRFPELLIEN